MTEIVDLLKANSEGTLGDVTDDQLSALATYYAVHIRKPGVEGEDAMRQLLQLFRTGWPKGFSKRFRDFVLHSVKNDDNPTWRQNCNFIEKMGVL
jgi:hypothetical protein